MHRYTVAVYFGRQLGCRLPLTHLSKNLIRIRVRFYIEIDSEGYLTIVGVVRIHVVHVVHTAHLLLNGSSYRLFHCQSVGTDIRGLNLDFWRRDVRKLRGRQAQHSDNADNDHNDRNHHGHDRTIYEELVHD